MSKKKKKAVVPRLRFPEFRDAGPWEVRTIEDIAKKVVQGGTPKTSVAEYWNGEIPWLTPAEMGDDAAHHYTERTVRTISVEGLQNSSADLLPVNSVIVSSRAPIGYVTINKVEMATNQGCKGIVPKADVYSEFLYFSVLVANRRLNDLGAGAGFTEISASTLKVFPIPVPRLAEQQKIADCLSSLDDLIRAEELRLKALQAHKNGLMQQLFPSEGETTPRLRFPEFRDAGPWEMKRLREMATISNGLTADQSNNSDGLKVTRIETISDGYIDISKVGYISRMEGIERFRLKVGDILFSHINSQAHIGKTALVEEDLDLYHGMNLLRLQIDNKKYNPRFFYYFLNTNFFRKSIRDRANQAVNQASINQTELGNSKIAVPSTNEQQKIADCLSSLDDLIRAQGKRLEALKQHKKGLMQQLFPQEVA